MEPAEMYIYGIWRQFYSEQIYFLLYNSVIAGFGHRQLGSVEHMTFQTVDQWFNHWVSKEIKTKLLDCDQ